MSESDTFFPACLVHFFGKLEDDNPLKGYYTGKSFAGELKWLVKVFDESVDIPSEEEKSTVMIRNITNPYSTDWSTDPSVYAHLPGDLTVKQLANCCPDFGHVLDHAVFSDTFDEQDPNSRFSLLPGTPPSPRELASSMLLEAR